MADQAGRLPKPSERDRRDARSRPTGRDRNPTDNERLKESDDRRYRSRSRERRDRRRERSRSRERRPMMREEYGGRDREYDRRRGDGRTRSRSRDRRRSRRDEEPRQGRYQERSRSPIQDHSRLAPRTRSRSQSAPRGPRGDRYREAVKPKDVPRRRNMNTNTKGPDSDGKMDIDHGTNADDVETMMKEVMGFTNFNTTQNKKVPGNDVWGVRKEKKTQYRQYMNRLGGFNRPLSPTRE